MRTQNTYDPFQIDNPEQHDIRYFAMLNDAVAISGDEDLEGGTPRKALAYYNYLLHIKLPNCPIGFNLKEAQETALKKRMNNLVKFNALLEKLHTEGTLFTKSGIST